MEEEVSSGVGLLQGSRDSIDPQRLSKREGVLLIIAL